MSGRNDDLQIAYEVPVLSPRQEAFASMLCSGLSITTAYEQAGYNVSGKPSTWKANAYKLAKEPGIVQYRNAVRTAQVDVERASLNITRDWTNVQLHEVVSRGMQATPVIDKATGEPIGEWQYDAKNVIKALEVMCKSNGLMESTVNLRHSTDSDVANMGREQLVEYVTSLIIGANIAQEVLAQLSTEVAA